MQRFIGLDSSCCLMVLGSGSVTAAQQNARPATQGAAPAAQARGFIKDPRLDLSAAQERAIYRSVTNAKTTRLSPDTPLVVGTMIPKSGPLHGFSRNVTQQVGAAANYRYVKLEDRKLLLVDPTNRMVAGIITNHEGSLDADRTAPGRGPKSR